MYVQARPIVFYPECTKSNGKGVLQLPEHAVELIKDSVAADFKVHVLRFDYGASSASLQPYNSTDVRGLRHTLIMLAQFLNKMQVQYMFNLQKVIMNKTTDEVSKKIREALHSKGHEYSLDKDYHDH